MAETTPVICKECKKEKAKYGVWVDGVCPDCITNKVLSGKLDADCAKTIAHFQDCEKCKNNIIR